MYRIAFVCLGNICRSPMAELVLRRQIDEAGLSDRVAVRSAGTGDYHVGEPADERASATLRDAGYDASRHRAAQFVAEDFTDVDLVLALDRSNAANLRRIAPDAASAGKIALLRAYDPTATDDLDVPDPYFGGPEGFPHALALVEQACRGVLEHVQRELDAKRSA